MLSAVLLLGLTSHAPHECVHHAALQPGVAHLVASAWDEAETLRQEPRPLARDHQKAIDDDRALGQKYSEMVEKEMKLSEDKAMEERLQRIGAALAKVANATPVEVTWGDRRLNPFEYQFKVLKGDDVNAFSLPGGFIYFFEGLISYAESDDELAGVVAHEIAHASLRHVATLQREQSRLSAIEIPAILIAILAGGTETGGAVGMLTTLSKTALGSGWSLKAETAADYAGFQYMKHSTYDPTGMLTFIERLARDERSKPRAIQDWGIFQTHPPTRKRAESLVSYMRQAKVPIRRSHVTTTFRTTLVPGDDGTVTVRFNDRDLFALAGPDAERRGREHVIRLNAFFDTVPALFELQNGPGGQILGQRRLLVKLTPQDAERAGVPLEKLKEDTLQNLRSAMYFVSFQIWDGR
jgi:beta-barrel assembly-enhancing protease